MTEADPAKEGGESSHPIFDNLLEDLAQKVFHLVQQRQPRQSGIGDQTQTGNGGQSRPESGDQIQSTSRDRSEAGGGDQPPSPGEQKGQEEFPL